MVKMTGEQVYEEHIKQVLGPDAKPRTPFLELSDMAIQGYEIEADMVNQAQSEED